MSGPPADDRGPRDPAPSRAVAPARSVPPGPPERPVLPESPLSFAPGAGRETVPPEHSERAVPPVPPSPGARYGDGAAGPDACPGAEGRETCGAECAGRQGLTGYGPCGAGADEFAELIGALRAAVRTGPLDPAREEAAMAAFRGAYAARAARGHGAVLVAAPPTALPAARVVRPVRTAAPSVDPAPRRKPAAPAKAVAVALVVLCALGGAAVAAVAAGGSGALRGAVRAGGPPHRRFPAVPGAGVRPPMAPAPSRTNPPQVLDRPLGSDAGPGPGPRARPGAGERSPGGLCRILARSLRAGRWPASAVLRALAPLAGGRERAVPYCRHLLGTHPWQAGGTRPAGR